VFAKEGGRESGPILPVAKGKKGDIQEKFWSDIQADRSRASTNTLLIGAVFRDAEEVIS